MSWTEESSPIYILIRNESFHYSTTNKAKHHFDQFLIRITPACRTALVGGCYCLINNSSDSCIGTVLLVMKQSSQNKSAQNRRAETFLINTDTETENIIEKKIRKELDFSGVCGSWVCGIVFVSIKVELNFAATC